MADSMPGEVKHVVYEWNDAADIFSKLLLRAVGENLPTYSSEKSQLLQFFLGTAIKFDHFISISFLHVLTRSLLVKQ